MQIEVIDIFNKKHVVTADRHVLLADSLLLKDENDKDVAFFRRDKIIGFEIKQ